MLTTMRLATLLSAQLLLGGISAHAQSAQPLPIVDCEPRHEQREQPEAEKEPACLAKLQGLASREGDTLSLVLDGNQTKLLRNEQAGCEGEIELSKCYGYTLIGYRPIERIFILSKTFHEGRTTVLISAQTGQEILLPEPPRFSPSGRHFVSVSDNEAYEIGNMPDVVIYTTEGHNPGRLVWSYRVPKGVREAWAFAGWIGEDRVRLKPYYEHERSNYSGATVIRHKHGWSMKKHKAIQ